MIIIVIKTMITIIIITLIVIINIIAIITNIKIIIIILIIPAPSQESSLSQKHQAGSSGIGTRRPIQAQDYVSKRSLNLQDGRPEALPKEVKDYWSNIPHSSMMKEKHPNRNAVIQKDDNFSTKIDFSGGAHMNTLQQVFSADQRKLNESG